jgi:hypothetical protein
MKINIGDYVRIVRPIPKYKGLYKLKGNIGKVVSKCGYNGYNIYFKYGDASRKDENQTYLFFKSEIEKITIEEAFMEML